MFPSAETVARAWARLIAFTGLAGALAIGLLLMAVLAVVVIWKRASKR